MMVCAPARTLWLLFWLGCLLPITLGAEPVVIKFATLAPEGTPWMHLMEEMNQEIQRQSNGQVAFRFYAGGIAGDERDVIRKMRIQQLHGGAFSGFGLGHLLPESRVLELPMLFRDADEAEHVAGALFAPFAKTLEQNGSILLSLYDAGAVYIFSKHAMRSRADLARAKIWLWQGDSLARTIFQAYGIVPVPLSLPDVLPSLQSGLIDACYGTPLAVLALQWFTQVHYYFTLPIARVMTAFVVSQQQWHQLSATQQSLVRETVQKYSSKAARTMRRYEQKALPLLHMTGIQPFTLPADDVADLQQRSEQVHRDLIGNLYSAELFARVVELRNQYREAHPSPSLEAGKGGDKTKP
jgi:TRAP-type C4-dicarboxylate transport system substrate-binding protein